MKAQFQVFKKYRFLLKNLISRDLKVKYRRSFLGLAWSILNPFLMMLVISAVFSNIFKFDIPYFPIYYLTGALLYNFVVEATNGSMVSIINAAPLIKKSIYSKVYFPLGKMYVCFCQYAFYIDRRYYYDSAYADAAPLDFGAVSDSDDLCTGFFCWVWFDIGSGKCLFSGYRTSLQCIHNGMDVFDADYLSDGGIGKHAVLDCRGS